MSDVALTTIEYADDDGLHRIRPGESVAGLPKDQLAELRANGAVGSAADYAAAVEREAAERALAEAKADYDLALEFAKDLRVADSGESADKTG